MYFAKFGLMTVYRVHDCNRKSHPVLPCLTLLCLSDQVFCICPLAIHSLVTVYVSTVTCRLQLLHNFIMFIICTRPHHVMCALFGYQLYRMIIITKMFSCCRSGCGYGGFHDCRGQRTDPGGGQVRATLPVPQLNTYL